MWTTSGLALARSSAGSLKAQERIGYRDELRVGLKTDRRRMVHRHAAAAKDRDAE